jgi:holo-[acyl-carrier protein] synthase
MGGFGRPPSPPRLRADVKSPLCRHASAASALRRLSKPPRAATRVGIDLVDVPAFETRFAGRNDALAEIFTAHELTYCHRQRRPWLHLAARFAAKEALLKALTSGLTGSMRWHDIEITRDPAGTPGLNVTGVTRAALDRRGLVPCSVSLSHTASHAIAVVLLARA